MSALPSTCHTLGAELAAARDAAGLSEEAMAQRLMLSKRQIISLERGELKGFYGLSYYRMALRKYLVALGLPTDQLNRIDWSDADPTPTMSTGGSSQSFIPIDDDSSRSRVPAAAAVVLVALSAAGYLFWSSRPDWVSGMSPAIAVSTRPAVQATPPASPPVTAPEAAPAEPIEPPPAAQSPSTTSEPTADASLPPPPVDRVPVSAPATGVPLDGIRVAVSSTTWVFVRFEDNSTLERGVAGGSSLELERYPVYLAVGAAEGVSLVLNGRRVLLDSYAQNGQIRLSRQQLTALRP